jgi:hypothetical protein
MTKLLICLCLRAVARRGDERGHRQQKYVYTMEEKGGGSLKRDNKYKI